jgi:chorismate mutase/prephenate dehydrogenase
MLNPRRDEVTTTFRTAAEEVARALAAGDQPHFSTLFSEVRTFLGAFTETALEQSSFLIDRLVERS